MLIVNDGVTACFKECRQWLEGRAPTVNTSITAETNKQVLDMLYCIVLYHIGSRNTVIGIVTKLDAPSFECRKGQEIFLLSQTSRPALGATKPSIEWLPGRGGVEQPKCDAEVKNEWSYTSSCPVYLHDLDTDNFKFYYIYIYIYIYIYMHAWFR